MQLLEMVRQLLMAGIEINVSIHLDRNQHPARCACGWEQWYRTPHEAARALKLHRETCAGTLDTSWISEMHSTDNGGAG